MFDRLVRSCVRRLRHLWRLPRPNLSTDGEVAPPAQELQRTPTLDRCRHDQSREERR